MTERILQQFKQNLVAFIDELILQFPEEGDFVLFRLFVNLRIPSSQIMHVIITKILPHKEMILKKDEDFFLNHCDLFSDLQEDNKNKVNHFKRLWRSGRLDVDDKKIVWQWFDTFIHLAETYQKIKTQC